MLQPQATSQTNLKKSKTRNKTKNPKRQRLIQVEAEIQELVHIFSYENQEKMDKLMIERWQLRYQLNL